MIMKNNMLRAMIEDGYTGIQVAEFEMCIHNFKMSQIFKSGIFEEPVMDVICIECGLDAHGANIMGLDPLYYSPQEKRNNV